MPPKIYLAAEEYRAAREKLAGLTRPIVVLCPDAGMRIKRWNEQNFIKVGQELGTSIVVLVGSDQEQSASEKP